MRKRYGALIFLSTLLSSPVAFANAKIFCTVADGGNWASADDLNSQLDSFRKAQAGLSVSAPAIASYAPHGDDAYPGFEMCVTANFGPTRAAKNSRIVCATAKEGRWASPDTINDAIADLQKAGKNVQASAPAVTINIPAGNYPNLELCVTLQY